ncbi:MAG: hypothetical protein ACO2ZC_11805, partial [Pseudomonadales bacterium]
MSLVARHLEAAGIPTVVVGSARDIVETCGVPRFLFVDYPLGNPCGRPWAPAEQKGLFAQALTLLERAYGPRTTVQAPERWVEDPAADVDPAAPLPGRVAVLTQQLGVERVIVGQIVDPLSAPVQRGIQV